MILDSCENLTTSSNFSKMSKLSVLSFYFFISCTIHCQDYTKTDYCKLTTNRDCVEGADANHGGHPACKCTPVAPRKEIQVQDTKAIVAFRRKILDAHNKYRNLVASGKETRVPHAANMMVLNYDLEMEHIARCRGLNSFGSPVSHETCRYDSKNKPYGQNLYGTSAYEEGDGSVESYVKAWYDEVGDVKGSVIGRFDGGSGMIGHFTQVVWAETTHVGCVRVWNKNHPAPAWRLVLICNYKTAGNMLGRPVYKAGTACSACPGDTKCETGKYPALCGKLQPVPETKVTVGREQNAKSDRNIQNWVLIVASSISMVFIF